MNESVPFSGLRRRKKAASRRFSFQSQLSFLPPTFPRSTLASDFRDRSREVSQRREHASKREEKRRKEGNCFMSRKTFYASSNVPFSSSDPFHGNKAPSTPFPIVATYALSSARMNNRPSGQKLKLAQ